MKICEEFVSWCNRMMISSNIDCLTFIPLIQTQQSNQCLRASFGPLTCVTMAWTQGRLCDNDSCHFHHYGPGSSFTAEWLRSTTFTWTFLSTAEANSCPYISYMVIPPSPVRRQKELSEGKDSMGLRQDDRSHSSDEFIWVQLAYNLSKGKDIDESRASCVANFGWYLFEDNANVVHNFKFESHFHLTTVRPANESRKLTPELCKVSTKWHEVQVVSL